MVIRYVLTPELRVELKQPLGTLIRGSFNETMKRLKDIIEKEEPTIIVSVGDTVSRNLSKSRVRTQLSIIDNKCMRRSVSPTMLTAEKIIHVNNPQGTITEEAIIAIKDALIGNQSVKVIVDGEEDLLALVAILHAPENSFVIYGQPHEGIVLVKVTSDKKLEIARILEAMERGSKN